MLQLILLFIYTGLVTDNQGHPLPYTTVYSEMHPEVGTATGPDGRFTIDTEDEIYGDFIFSYIGYHKLSVNAFGFLEGDTIVLTEQPIALEETVISTKKQKNKRKVMKALLDEVWSQMLLDFDTLHVSYHIVSDMRMDEDSIPWAFEQLIAHTYEMPFAKKNGQDSMYFWMNDRKRFLSDGLREKTDAFKQSDAIERLDKKGRKHYDLKWTVQNVDSGVVSHRSLWNMGNIRTFFLHDRKYLSRWTVDRENEGRTVLTYTEKHNYLGIFKVDYSNHYILNSETLSVESFSQQAEVWVNIPFGYKLNKDQLELANLFNMEEERVNRLVIRKMHATMQLNTIYRVVEGHKYKLERNMIVDGQVEGRNRNRPKNERDLIFPFSVKATQRSTFIRVHKFPMY